MFNVIWKRNRSTRWFTFFPLSFLVIIPCFMARRDEERGKIQQIQDSNIFALPFLVVLYGVNSDTCILLPLVINKKKHYYNLDVWILYFHGYLPKFTRVFAHPSISLLLQETSSAQYILQQYTAASGGQKLQNSIQNAYAMGKVKMIASEFETATRVTKNRNGARDAETGGFVLWQMNPDMWYVELAVGGSKVRAGCNGKIVWRHTPWLGAHTAKGPVRPLRRALQVNLPTNVHVHVPALILQLCFSLGRTRPRIRICFRKKMWSSKSFLTLDLVQWKIFIYSYCAWSSTIAIDLCILSCFC